MKEDRERYDFGWSWRWMHGYWIAGSIMMALAASLYYYLPEQRILLILVVIEAMILFAGNIVWRSSRKQEYMTLPWVDLFTAGPKTVLDAGCGSGRTTIALSKVMDEGDITAVDRFDASYIKEGGRHLIERNLAIAGISGMVKIVRGDLTELPIEDESHDAAISTYAIDHMKKKGSALSEIHRVLKPGGRFLLVVFVPNWATFLIANALCLFLTSRKKWRTIFKEAGFILVDEGTINGGGFFLAEKIRSVRENY
ncbi:MAG TPA: class I SAM-dependent methyltransferase [Spirochaetota bacterium]|nr:class I SAM-dependent methyltransferase [Spirochaetota bacterium]